MTTIKHGIKLNTLKQEVRQIRQAVQKIAASKDSARRFLVSTGVYGSNGHLNPQYR